MDGGVVLPISVKDNASSKFATIIKNAEKLNETLAQGPKAVGNKMQSTFLGSMKDLAKGSAFASAAFGVGTTISKYIGKGVSAAFDITNEMTATLGKLRMALDEGTSVNENLAKIEQTALKSRIPMEDLTESVAKLGLTAGQYFSNDELIAFSGSLASYGALVGATTKQMKDAQYQLIQAFSKGRMAMDDYKPIMNSLPGISNELAKSLGVSIKELQEMVSAGEITTEKIKQAFLGMGESVQEKLQNMPLTLEQRLYGIRNALYAGKKAVNDFVQTLANTKTFQVILGGIELTIKRVVSAFNRFTKVIDKVFGKSETDAEKLEKSIKAFSNVLTFLLVALVGLVGILMLRFVVLGVQAFISGLTATKGWAPLISWFILIIAIIGIVAMAITGLGITFSDVLTFVGGFIGFTVAFVWNLFLALLDFLLGAVNILARAWVGFANFFKNIFKDPIATVIHGFADMANAVLNIVKIIASALDKVFGTSLAKGVGNWMKDIDKWADKAADKWGNGEYDKDEWKDLSSESLGLARASYNDFAMKGAEIGGAIGKGLDNFGTAINDVFGKDQLGLGKDTELSDYDASTGKGSLSTKLDDDSIDEIKAFAEIQYRLTYRHITPNVNIKFGDVRETADLDDITRYIRKMMAEDLEELYITEGGD